MPEAYPRFKLLLFIPRFLLGKMLIQWKQGSFISLAYLFIYLFKYASWLVKPFSCLVYSTITNLTMHSSYVHNLEPSHYRYTFVYNSSRLQ